jgi:hypothetical protein
LFGISFEFWAAKGVGDCHSALFPPSSRHHAVRQHRVNPKTEAGAGTFNTQHKTMNGQHQNSF